MDVEVRPLAEADLDAADHVFRAAFDTVLGADVLGDTDVVRTRFRSGHTAALGAFSAGGLVGSTVVTRWGSVGHFGPLSVAPPRWDSGIGARLVAATVDVLEGWGVAHQGLFTYANSPRHLELYQRFGFWPRFLTAIMSRSVTGLEPVTGRVLSTADDPAAARAAAASVTDAVLPGLDLTGEIDAVTDQGLGDVVLVDGGFAVCHAGPGTEAGSGTAFVKFGVVAPGPDATAAFDALLGACQGWAAAQGTQRLALGVNTARRAAYRHLLAAGFRTDLPGVTMHRPDVPAYDRPDVLLLDDWR